MPHPLLQSVPLGFPDFRKRVESYLAQWRQDLASLESGDIGLGPDGRPITVVIAGIHKRIVARYEAILAELDSGELL
jgi:hypothetical protein